MTYNIIRTLLMQITWTFHSCHVKTHAAWMTFHIKTLEGEDLVFMLLALEVDATKSYFPQYHICVKILYGT